MKSKPALWEWLLVGLVTLLGGGIRLAGITHQGLSHFDAGVYAESSLWPWTGQLHFVQGFYSPPLYPFLVGLVQVILGGPVDWAGSFVSALSGALLLPVSWWISRGWFGPVGGLTGASLLAIGGLQIAGSRTGITDSTFTLLFALGLAAGLSALRSQGVFRLMLAGVAIGACWLTKYNGFLPLVLLAGFVFQATFITQLARLSLISLISFSSYFPWIIWFHVKHGYGSLIEHQRGYFLGPFAIGGTFQEFVADLSVVQTPSLAVGLLIAFLLTPGLRLSHWVPIAVTIGAVGLMDLVTWVWPIWLLLAGFGLASARDRADRWGLTWSVAWLLFLPAMYTPYVRLWLPTDWLITLVAAGGMASLGTWLAGAEQRDGAGRVVMKGFVTAAVIVGILWLSPSAHERWDFWRRFVYGPTAGYRNVAARLAERPEDQRFLTLCRWPMNYYLARAGREVAPLDGTPIDVDLFHPGEVLVVDRALADTPSFVGTVAQAKARWLAEELTGVEPDIMTLLDDFTGTQVVQQTSKVISEYDVMSIAIRR